MSRPEDFVIENGILRYYLGKDMKIDIPSNVSVIGYGAFQSCRNITDVKIPDGVIKIEENAFSGCNALSEIRIPASVKKIGKFAFCCSNIKAIIENKDTIIEGAFPRYAEIIYSDNFNHDSECVPESFVIENGVLKSYTGTGTDIIIPENVICIGESVFEKCVRLSKVHISNGIKIIGKNAFSNCINLSCVTLPDSVERIEDGAFKFCSELSVLSISSNIKYLGKNAFLGCKNLEKIEFSSRESNIQIHTIQPDLKTIDIPNIKFLTKIEFDYDLGNHDSLYQYINNILVDGNPLNEVVFDEYVAENKSCYNFLRYFPQIKVVLSNSVLVSGQKIPADIIPHIKPSPEQLVYLIIYQSGKKWSEYLKSVINKWNYKTIQNCYEKISAEIVLTNKQQKAFMSYLSDFDCTVNNIQRKTTGTGSQNTINNGIEGSKKIFFAGFKNKEAIESFVKSIGYKPIHSISKNINIAVINSKLHYMNKDINSAIYQAEKNGVKLYNWNQFVELLTIEGVSVPKELSFSDIPFPMNTKEQKLNAMTKLVEEEYSFLDTTELEFNDEIIIGETFMQKINFDSDVMNVLRRYNITNEELNKIQGTSNFEIISEALGGYGNSKQLMLVFIAHGLFVDKNAKVNFRIYRNKWDEQGEMGKMSPSGINLPELHWEINDKHPYGYSYYAKK